MRLFLSALLAVVLAACSRPAPSPAAVQEPAIWRIADADSEIWLFGSVHMLKPDLRWRGPRVDAAFASAEELITETSLPSAESSAAFAAFTEQHGRLPAGETLSDRLSAGDYARLRAAAQSLGIDPLRLQGERPWLVALQLSYADLSRSGQSSDAGVEAVLAAEAARRGMRISSLETPEQQLSVLANLAPADEARFLAITLGEIGQTEEVVADLDAAWARGDVAALEPLFEQQWREAGPGVHGAIILNRNRAWADAIERKLHGSGRVFIAVGAAHLIGEGSVVSLLRARGLQVEGP